MKKLTLAAVAVYVVVMAFVTGWLAGQAALLRSLQEALR